MKIYTHFLLLETRTTEVKFFFILTLHSKVHLPHRLLKPIAVSFPFRWNDYRVINANNPSIMYDDLKRITLINPSTNIIRKMRLENI